MGQSGSKASKKDKKKRNTAGPGYDPDDQKEITKATGDELSISSNQNPNARSTLSSMSAERTGQLGQSEFIGGE